MQEKNKLVILPNNPSIQDERACNNRYESRNIDENRNIQEDTHLWPPLYSLRVSTRAKRPFVQIAPNRGLEVIIPKRKYRINPTVIQSLLQENKSWIQKQLQRFILDQNQKMSEPMLPESLNFLGINKTIHIKYVDLPTQIRLSLNADCLTLKGPIQDTKRIILALKRFLLQQAKEYLLPWLARLSITTGLNYSSAIIRHQTSLWGSCTSKGKISLNSKLLFLPKELIDYVILHELCHTVHLNHSQRFWSLLKKFDPLCLSHRRDLRSYSRYLPRFCERTLHKESLF